MKWGMAILIERVEKGYTQTKLAAMAGCCAGHISAIERGREVPSPGMLTRICKALGRDLDDVEAREIEREERCIAVLDVASGWRIETSNRSGDAQRTASIGKTRVDALRTYQCWRKTH